MSIGSQINSELLTLYDKGLSEVEAHAEISKTHNRDAISQKTVNKYFEIFKTGEQSLDKNITKASRKKLTDEYLIALIEENPDLSMSKLAVLAGTSRTTISRKIKQLNSGSERVKYISKKNKLKFSDEFLIDLVNKNPDHSISELAELASISKSAICSRIKQFNSRGEKLNYISKKREYKYTDEFLINLINENPDLNMSELAKLANATTNSIFQRIKRINNEGIKLSYVNKSTIPSFTDEFLRDLVIKNPDLSVENLSKLIGTSSSFITHRLSQIKSNIEVESCSKNHMPKFTDEYLVELISENPDFNMRKLSKLLDTSPTTIANRIKKINSNGERVRYIRKDFSKDKMNACDLSSLNSKLSDEFLIGLVFENPDLGVKELAKLADTSARVISIRLKQIDWISARESYTNKNSAIVEKNRN
jgi:DNA-binding Lrp family transcriptional regulator